ncbi:MAG: 50S ribosomal protein L22 [Patescibacteria group bacterium]
MEVIAKLRYLKMAPRKVRLVIDEVRGLSVKTAEAKLRFMPKWAAMPVLKLLSSAVANAINNHKLDKVNLYIKSIQADEGPPLKRFKPRAFGRVSPIKKRSTHITLVLDEKKKSKKNLVKSDEAKVTELKSAKPKKDK